MKQYVIDQLRPEDYDQLKTFMDTHCGESRIEGVYWIALDETLHSENQKGHTACKPFYFAVELMEDRISCELLVRTQNRIRCDCIAYATPEQRAWLMDYLDAILEKLEIAV